MPVVTVFVCSALSIIEADAKYAREMRAAPIQQSYIGVQIEAK